MTRLKALAVSVLLASSALPGAARAEDADALMDQFFAIWSNNAKVTPRKCARSMAPTSSTMDAR